MEKTTPLIIAKNLSKSFKKIEVLKDLTIDFNAGERVALIGQNGAGKTTLIRCILGLYVFDGKLEVLDQNPRVQREAILQNIGFVPQIPPPLKMTVSEMLDFFAKITNTNKNKFLEISNDLGLEIEKHQAKQFLSLSGGMKQKLLLSFAIGRNPKILILDEPSANLDPQARKIFFQYLQDFNKDALMILSSHRMNEIATLVNRIVEMDFGEIVVDKQVSELPLGDKAVH